MILAIVFQIQVTTSHSKLHIIYKSQQEIYFQIKIASLIILFAYFPLELRGTQSLPSPFIANLQANPITRSPVRQIPARMMSTPVGHQRSPCLSNNRIVLFARVLKYSPSSTCVPSDSNTTDTFSLCGTPSFSLPKIG